MAALHSVQSHDIGTNYLYDMKPDWMGAEHMTGTSLVAAEYDGGVVIGADSRTSMGSFVSNRVTDKLTKITDRIYCCRSGSSADTQAVADIVAYHLAFHQIELGQAPLVKTAASVFRDLCYTHRDSLLAGIICAGWDEQLGGQVYSIPLGGMIMRQPVSIGGSGSTFVYGYVDSQYKPGMSKDETVDMVTKTLALAMARDCSSGGLIRIGIISKDGVERKIIYGDQIPKFYEG